MPKKVGLAFTASTILAVYLSAATGVVESATMQRLTEFEGEDREPSASPDGKYLAYLSDRKNNRENELWLADLISGEHRALVTNMTVTSPPTWEPDSSGLIFLASEAGEIPKLMKLELSETSPTAIAADFADDLLMAPDLSPDGKTLTLSRLVDSESNWNIVFLDLTTGQQKPFIGNSQYREVWPRFSFDEKSLFFFSRKDTGGEQDELYKVSLQNGNMERLTFDPTHDFTPAPSPNGNQLAFISNRTGKPQLHVMTHAPKSITQVDTEGKRAGHPTWSADGSQLFVTLREDGETADIYAIRYIQKKSATADKNK